MLARRALIAALACLAACNRGSLSGSFHSVAHKGSGRAVISAGHLRLVNIKTYPSDDLKVCMIAAPDAEDNETVVRSSPICLGPLDSSAYPLPAGLDLNRYRAVVIWSPSYGVNFTTAPLSTE